MSPDELLDLGKQLVEDAAERGVTLRILGHLAVRAHIQAHRELIERLKRVATNDIDFMGYSKEQDEADSMFKGLGYAPDPAVAYSREYGIQRLIYHHPNVEIIAEIFLDELNMAHTLDFRNRLELDSPTISLVDLILSKLQIHQITEKDIQDVITLLAEHDLGRGNRELIDIDYLLKLTKDDWGLYYTSKTNLGLVREFLAEYDVIDSSTKSKIEHTLTKIDLSMESEPKSTKWKLRARVGTRLKWYQEVRGVEDVHR